LLPLKTSLSLSLFPSFSLCLSLPEVLNYLGTTSFLLHFRLHWVGYKEEDEEEGKGREKEDAKDA